MKFLQTFILTVLIITGTSAFTFEATSLPAHLAHYAPGIIHELNSASDFSEIIAHADFVVIDFYSPTCPPCNRIAPIVAGLAQQNGTIIFIKVNTKLFPQLASGLQGVPVFLFFYKGQQVDSLRGANEALLKQKVAALLARAS